MGSSLLQIVQDAAAEMNLIPTPQSAFNASDQVGFGLGAHANRTGRQLMQRWDWEVLKRPHFFTSVQGQAQYPLPSDFERIVDDTVWDSGNFWPVRGSLSSQEWQALKNSFWGAGMVYKRYRLIRADTSANLVFEIDPPSGSDGENLFFEYVSNAWVNDAGTMKDRFTLDTDTSVFSDDLMVMGAKWRYQSALGLTTTSFDEFWRTAEAIYVAQRNPGVQTLYSSHYGDSRYGPRLLDNCNVQDSRMGKPSV